MAPRLPTITAGEVKRLRSAGKLVGEGLTAKAYLVQPKNGKEAILKVCKKREFQHIVKQEISVLQRLKPVALLMEYCQGRTLEDLRWDPEVSNKTMMEVALQATHQVSELHKRGFAHNDIKTDNCIANISHTPFSVRLIDFGNSTHLGESPRYELVPEGSHIAPELCRLGNASTATDAFSLGCLLVDLMEARAKGFPKMVSRLSQCAGREDPKWRPSLELFAEALQAAVS
ncbi:serine/threonine-protein kinase nekl-2-like [Penaeus monodon]|uniref:serine/threonine-protein kinase nekl-2-like n=1 Tax=Penaeus monodon TaxID=6687 RepID=UPI0018A73A12|nr:serine/threonine-protein kinase nekl-2-like [Penaeus monodon]